MLICDNCYTILPSHLSELRPFWKDNDLRVIFTCRHRRTTNLDLFIVHSALIRSWGPPAEDRLSAFMATYVHKAESFKTARNESDQAPMDFANVTGWKVCCRLHFFLLFQAIMKLIFPAVIDEDLLKLSSLQCLPHGQWSQTPSGWTSPMQELASFPRQHQQR
jgi:hypothetical protein